jgi:acyl-CoA synthetase (NDP forming)
MAACDVCEMERLTIPAFSAETQKKVEELLPPLAIRTNPVDMGPAWYDSAAMQGIVKTVLEDRNIDAVLLCVMFASANRSAAGVLTDLLSESRPKKPILCCFSSPPGIWEDEIKQLERSGIPNYSTPERAAKALSNLYRYHQRRG